VDYLLAVMTALFAWWFSTGAILYLVGMPRQTFPVSMLAVTITAGLGLWGLWVLRADTSVAAAVLSFGCGLAVWAWHETSFLTGYVTGSRRSPAPPAESGWQRFICAAQTLTYHELAILLTAIAVTALTWGEMNQVGTWTFVILWLARLSAKLNVFFGVPNLTEEFLPEHLEYLKTYFRRRPMNLFFPFSVTAATALVGFLTECAIVDAKIPFEVWALTLLGTLAALAVVEHWFLVLPMPSAALWSWGMHSRNSGSAETVASERQLETVRGFARVHQVNMAKPVGIGGRT
jgi:putative photosynthetic complex assembly protein 2